MDARVRVGARSAAFLDDSPSPFAGRMKETKQQAHREKETPDAQQFTRPTSFSGREADDQDGAPRVRCHGMRPSAVRGARRCTNALSRCGLSLHAGCPPLLCCTAWHSVSTACRIQARVARTTWLRLAHAKNGPQQLLRTPKCALAA